MDDDNNQKDTNNSQDNQKRVGDPKVDNQSLSSSGVKTPDPSQSAADPNDIRQAGINQPSSTAGQKSQKASTDNVQGESSQTQNLKPETNDLDASIISSSPTEVPKKYGGKKIIATIFGILLLIGGVTAGVFLVQREQEIRERAASGAECNQAEDCVLLENPGNSGSFQVPETISHIFITAKEFHRFDPPGVNDGCYDVEIDDRELGWERVGDGPDCKDISNIQIWITEAEPPPPVDVSCPLSPAEGRVIVTLNESADGQILSNRNEDRATFGPVSTNIDPGTYKVTLVSFDDHHLKPNQTQPEEQWYLETTSGNTGTIADIPDGQDWLTQVVNEDFEISSTITSVTAKHAAFPTNNPNSVSPVCAAFDVVEEEQPTPTLEPTPTSPPPPPEITAECSDVIAYDTDWNFLSNEDLNSLQSGDVIRLAVSGTTSEGVLDMARFTVNGGSIGTTTDKKPESDEFYIEYTIPEGVDSFAVDGEIHHAEIGWF